MSWKILEGMSHRQIFRFNERATWLRVRTYSWAENESARLELLSETGWENLHDIQFCKEGQPLLSDQADNGGSRIIARAKSSEIAIQRCMDYADTLYSDTTGT